MFTKFGNYCYFLCVFNILCFVPPSLSSVHQRKLLTDLFESYTVLERPVLNDDDKVVLSFSISLMQILKVDIQEEMLVTNLWLKWGWNDENLRWEPNEYGNVTHIHVPSQKIWIPDVLMYNNADDEYKNGNQRTNVVVSNSGNCTYVTPGIFKSICKIDTTWFPFDEQRCEMKFGSWVFDGNQLDLQLTNDGNEDLSGLIGNAEWSVESFTSRRNEVYYMCCPEPFVDISFMLKLKRRSDYYKYNLIIPISFVALCGLFVFVLPTDSGSKIIFGIATLALIYLCQCNLSRIQSPTSTPLVSIYFSYLFTLNLLSLLSSVFVLNVHYSTSKMPNWIRSVFVGRLSYFLLVRQNHLKIINNSTSDVPSNIELNNIESNKIVNGPPESESLILNELRKMGEKLRKDEMVEEMKNDWKLVAMVLDRILMVVFVIFFISVTIKVWLSYNLF